jgi:hypothetical protein
MFRELYLINMSENGEKIQEYLGNLQREISLGCESNGHKYSHNGTISCVTCGNTKLD